MHSNLEGSAMNTTEKLERCVELAEQISRLLDKAYEKHLEDFKED